jgi:hypothetical protein
MLAQRNCAAKKDRLFWLVVVVVSSFMMISASRPVWQIISALQMIQFPSRFCTVLCVSVAALLALGVNSTNKPISFYTGFNLASIAVAVGVCLYINLKFIEKAYHAYNPELIAQQYKKVELGADHWEYATKWVEGINRDELLQNVKQEGGSSKARVEGGGSVTALQWRPRDILLFADLPQASTLAVKQFYYPGWTAQILENRDELSVLPSSNSGLVSIRVPAGRYHVSLRLGHNQPELIGQLISAVSLALTALLTLNTYIPRWRGIREHRYFPSI